MLKTERISRHFHKPPRRGRCQVRRAIDYAVDTRQQQAPTGKCRKRGYATLQEAQDVLNGIRVMGNKRKRNRQERKVYECPTCNKFHLTSQKP